MSEVADDSLTGDKEAIEMFTDAMLKMIGEYTKVRPITRLDLFLGVHNLHKLLVVDIAKVWAADSIPAERTYSLADKQFHQAMRELTYPGQGQLGRKARRRLVSNAKKN